MNKPLFLLLGVCFFMNLNAQKHNCGYETCESDDKRIISNLKNPISLRKGDPIYVPIQFFIVSNEFGNGAIEIFEVENALCKLNTYFDSIDIQFYLKGDYIFINNQIIYDQEGSVTTSITSEFLSNKVDSAINVFIGGELGRSSSGYYTSSSDVIYMDKSYVNDEDVILPHEIGHFFSLRHTFYGWENTTYDPNESTPTEIFYRGEFRQVELVNREGNCEEAGDLLCDTPSDYITDWEEGCDYTGGAIDPVGEVIDPDERNIMAYYSFAECSDYIFSQEQIQLMQTDLSMRSDLFLLLKPELTPIDHPTNLIYPPNESLVFALQNPEFEWSSTENADYYLFELSFVSNFAVNIETVFTTETSLILDKNLFDGRPYFWRVKARSFVDPCNSKVSEVFSFTTDETASIKEGNLSNLKIFPNPNSQENLYFENIDLSKKNTLTISSMNGNIVFRNEELKSDKIEVSNFPSGSYILNIENFDGRFTDVIIIN